MQSVSHSPRLRAWASALLAVLVIGTGCGDDDSTTNPTAASPGTRVVFDLDADLTDAAHFYDLPYPSDLRLDGNGRPDVRGFPLAAGNTVLPPVKAIAARSTGFPTIPAAYFRFDAPLAARDPNSVIPPEPHAPLLLLDVDPASPDRGHLVPVVATVVPTDPYAPANLLAIGPMPGVVLAPRRTYAFVVQRAFGDETGAALGVPLSIAQLRDGQAPPGTHGATALALYAPLWSTLDDIGVARTQVAAATVFTTGDVVSDLAALSSAVLAGHGVDIDGLALDPADGATHPRFCELHGHVRFPQFQRGKPPYNTQGLFELDANGLPIVQREEDAPVVVTIPRSAMPPGGYPLVVYVHGSAGLSTQVVDRGPVTTPGGDPTPGEGPAHVLAAHGFAVAASAMPLNPERLPGAELRAYLNIRNLASYPDTFRQGTIEQRLLIDALARLQSRRNCSVDARGHPSRRMSPHSASAPSRCS